VPARLLARVPPTEALKAAQIAIIKMHLAQTVGDVHAWRSKAHPQQLLPDSGWHVAYTRGGRGSGKTWAAAHQFSEWTVDDPGGYAIVAPTYADARDTCVEGPSGYLAALGTNRVEVEVGRSAHVESWNRSMGEIRLRNGTQIYVDGADDGALRIQGKNLKGTWADEIGLWRRWRQAWEESIRYAVRISPARIIATGTPKRGHELVRMLVKDEHVVQRVLNTLENAANLDPSIVDEWVRRYSGTALGRQELGGEVLEDVPGAAWQRMWIDAHRLMTLGAIELVRTTVGIDPAITSAEGADATGIVAAGAALISRAWCESHFRDLGVPLVPDSHGTGAHEHYFVLADESGVMTPSQWGHHAVGTYKRLAAGRIVGETNRGGDMIEHTIRTVDQDVAYKPVRATRGKAIRAEPVAALYEQGKVHHVGFFPEMEDQQCSYVPGDTASPDRMDALVWALTDLAITDEPSLLGLYRKQAEDKRAQAAQA
jgi:phage terminase large subunit-like protein